MKRLTYYSMKGSENDGYYLKPGVSKEQARFWIGSLEDLLGDDYDFNRLKELAQADREKRITVWSPDEREDIKKAVKVAARDLIQIGEAIADVPIGRIRELVEADKEGRCVLMNYGYSEDIGNKILNQKIDKCSAMNSEMIQYASDSNCRKNGS